MSAATTTQPTRRGGARTAALLHYDGPIATVLLKAFQFFVVSVSFLATAVPVIAFQALVGVQPTHLALWLAGTSLLPLVPGTVAAVVTARRVLLASDGAAAGRVFWRSFATAVRSRWWLSLGVAGTAVILGYDYVILGGTDVATLAVFGGLALLGMLVIGVASLDAAGRGERAARATLVRTGRAIAAKPHIALAWLLLCGLAALTFAVPVVGTAVALFAPALVAAGIAICNEALGFTANTEGPVS